MVRGKTSLLKIILSLTVLNSTSLLLFFFHPDFFGFNPHDHPAKYHCCDEPDISSSKSLKSWPILPSYFTWTRYPNVALRSCEGYFGNGFTKEIDVLRSSMDLRNRKSGGWFRCFYSATLRSSICEAGGLRMVPDRIRMSVGGESLKMVMGRKEDDELPQFEPGAFQLDGGDGVEHGRKLVEDMFLSKYMPEGKTMRELVKSIRVVKSSEFKCSEWVEEPTLLITRFEYANIFHTVTDWYSAYVASRVTGLPRRPHVIFVDGHCKTQLEETWEALFSSMRYAKNSTGPLCFRRAVLTPLGYETALFKGLSESIGCKGSSHSKNPHETARLSEFGEMVASAFGLPVDTFQSRIENPTPVHNVLFVRREDYLAHPRHGGKVQSRLGNEWEVFDYLRNWVSGHPKCKVNLMNGLFAHMSMKEQVKAIRNASVIMGAHGAGLTHIIAAKPNAVVLEIISSEFRRPHFALISQWKGLEYHAIDLSGSFADPREVAGKLSNILTSLGC